MKMIRASPGSERGAMIATDDQEKHTSHTAENFREPVSTSTKTSTPGKNPIRCPYIEFRGEKVNWVTPDCKYGDNCRTGRTVRRMLCADCWEFMKGRFTR